MAARSSTSVLHYLDIGRMGRGEVINQELQRQGLTRTGKVPAVEYNGVVLNQHIPTLRYLARDLGRYDGVTNWEKFIVDAVSDIYIDWRFKWVENLGKPAEEYKNSFVPKYYDILAQYYSETDGPYLLSEKITYADFAVYQSIDNDLRTGTLPSTLPDPISKFKGTFEQRPNIARYIKENFPKL
ncbi:glutathione s-transferase chloride channel, c-terminal [Trichoderma arundinaceum]|uniref:Glutathione s-transferase chloride channel, c-terminal n=1 Tax=Trichoderma arundinaceum TaxID=490622 RepID=A0A395NVS0_TRIAR|nr:glutathione s-transferase chloride channel, c-terminal [Trichoderma arundinaceum]